MIQRDNRVSNFTVDNILNVKQKVVTPSLETASIVVRNNLILEPGITIVGLETTNTQANTTHLVATSDQLVLGAITTVTINAPPPTTDVVYTVPDIGQDGDIVVRTKSGEVASALTFTSPTTFAQASNQLVLGNAPLTTTLTAPTPTTARVYTIADVGTDASFVMNTSSATQTLNTTLAFQTGGLSLPTLTGTPSTLNYFEVATETIVLSSDNFASSPQNIDVVFVRLNNVVFLTLPHFASLGSGVSGFIEAPPVPVRFRKPLQASGFSSYMRVENESATRMGQFLFDALTNNIQISVIDPTDVGTSIEFSSSGIQTMGFSSYTITYTI